MIKTNISSVRAVSDPIFSFQPILFEGSRPSVSGDRVAVLERIRFVEKIHSTKASSNLLKSVGMIPMLARVCDDADLNVGGLDAQRVCRPGRVGLGKECRSFCAKLDEQRG